MQCIIMENTLIKLTLHDETKKKAHDSQIVRAKKTQVEPRWVQLQISIRHQPIFKPKLIGHWLPGGNLVDHIFLEAQCLARILQHVSPLTMAALSCNSQLHTLPTQYLIFNILFKTSEKCKR